MADYPIIFSAPMVLALLAGRKTMTRRLAWTPYDPAPPEKGRLPRALPRNAVMLPGRAGLYRPTVWQKVKPGDRLWGREAWNLWYASRDGEDWWPARDIPKEEPRLDEDARAGSCVDFPVGSTNRGTDAGRGPWRPSLHMPRWASRITILVQEVKREALQDISEADARAEGMQEPSLRELGGELAQAAWSERQMFQRLWNHLHGPDAWAANLEVVAMAGRVELRNIDMLPQYLWHVHGRCE